MRSISTARFSAILAGLVLLSGCEQPMHVRAKTLSPDRTKIAYLLEEEPAALVPMDSVVVIVPTNRRLDNDNDLVFRGGDMNGRHFGPLNIRWNHDDLLVIGYCSGRTSIFKNNWWDNHGKQPDDTEIILERELSGEWPASVPPDRRAGPPPCS
ncbi:MULTISPECIES: hypothetical protein [Sphingomonas]|jgi:hypothetical protein|uniref:hypothetical protein n=1 Tax=Sphingomonas TaxID=13687 RepID=UPI001AE51059